jgi:hypothetical protein
MAHLYVLAFIRRQGQNKELEKTRKEAISMLTRAERFHIIYAAMQNTQKQHHEVLADVLQR